MSKQRTTETAFLMAAQAQAGQRHFRVLVVDDNEMDRKLTIIQLGQAWPFERDLAVVCAGNGAEALEKMRLMRFALIVVDWKMPLMDGGEMLRTMRRLGIRIPVVVVSGLQRDEIAEDIEMLGGSFLNKSDLDPVSFRAAIAASIQLQGLVPAVLSNAPSSVSAPASQHAAA